MYRHHRESFKNIFKQSTISILSNLFSNILLSSQTNQSKQSPSTKDTRRNSKDIPKQTTISSNPIVVHPPQTYQPPSNPAPTFSNHSSDRTIWLYILVFGRRWISAIRYNGRAQLARNHRYFYESITRRTEVWPASTAFQHLYSSLFLSFSNSPSSSLFHSLAIHCNTISFSLSLSVCLALLNSLFFSRRDRQTTSNEDEARAEKERKRQRETKRERERERERERRACNATI